MKVPEGPNGPPRPKSLVNTTGPAPVEAKPGRTAPLPADAHTGGASIGEPVVAPPVNLKLLEMSLLAFHGGYAEARLVHLRAIAALDAVDQGPALEDLKRLDDMVHQIGPTEALRLLGRQSRLLAEGHRDHPIFGQAWAQIRKILDRVFEMKAEADNRSSMREERSEAKLAGTPAVLPDLPARLKRRLT